MHIGVDVGGTNTDAVLLNGTEVLASVKVPTTMDIGSGVVGAISDLLTRSGTDPTQIQSVMIGTTQFTNAFVEGKKLVPVAVYRAALPATEGVLPMIEFPSHLTRQIGTQSYLVGGGYEFDGRMIAPLDEKAVIEGAKDMRAKGIKSAVLSSVFTPINSEMEHRMAEIILNEAPDTELTLSGRDRPHRADRAGERCHHERLALRAVQDRSPCISECAQAVEHQLPVFRFSKRRHLDDRRICREIPGPHFRFRPHEFHAWGCFSLRRQRRNSRRYRRHYQ